MLGGLKLFDYFMNVFILYGLKPTGYFQMRRGASGNY